MSQSRRRRGCWCAPAFLTLWALASVVLTTGVGWTAPQSDVLRDKTAVPGAVLVRSASTGLARLMNCDLSYADVRGTPEDVALTFLRDCGDVFGLRQGAADLVFDGVITGEALQHVWFHQECEGIPVLGSAVVVHMTRDGRVVKANTNYLPDLRLPAPEAMLDAADVEWAAKQAASGGTDPLGLHTLVVAPPRLFVLASETEEPRLVWMTVTTSDRSDGSRPVAVDARSGLPVRRYAVASTGSGMVFNPNPWITNGGSIPADPDTQRQQMTLYDLDASGKLTGTHVKAATGSYGDSTGTQNASSTSSYHRADPGFEEVMAYYHIDEMWRYLKAMTGEEPYPSNTKVSAWVNNTVKNTTWNSNGYNPTDYDHYSFYDPYFEGSGGTLQGRIYLGRVSVGGVNYDAAEDAKAVIHMFAHKLLDVAQPNYHWFYNYYLDPQHPLDCRIESGAVAEAHADFLACNRFAHVEPGFSLGINSKTNDWNQVAHSVGAQDLDTHGIYTPPPGPAPGQASNASTFLSHPLWLLSQSIGQEDADRLVQEWIGNISDDPWYGYTTFRSASKDLLETDDAQNATAPDGVGANRCLLTTSLADAGLPMQELHDDLGSVVDYENSVYAHIEIEHADLAKLRVEVGVYDGATKYTLWTVQQADADQSQTGTPQSGTRILVAYLGDLSIPGTSVANYWPPTTHHKWFVGVTEVNETGVREVERLHELGVIRRFHVFCGEEPITRSNCYPYFSTPITWAPILDGQTAEATVTGTAPAVPANYAEIVLGHSDLSQLDMVLGVKDLRAYPTVGSTTQLALPGWRLRLTKEGMRGWASPADTVWPGTSNPKEPDLHVKVDLTGVSSLLPPSLDRRWYLAIRDTVGAEMQDWDLPSQTRSWGDHVGKLKDFALQVGGIRYTGSATFPLAISQTTTGYVLINPSHHTAASMSAGFSATPSAVTLGVGPTASPIWSQSVASPYRDIAISAPGPSYLPPWYDDQQHSTQRQWWLKVQTGSSAVDLNRFTFYDPSFPRLHRSASIAGGPPPKLSVGSNSVGYAYVPYQTSENFTDVHKEEANDPQHTWVEIEACRKAGIVNGYEDNTFRPTDPLARDQLAVFISRALAGGDAGINAQPDPDITVPLDVPTDHWAYKYINYCLARGVMNLYPEGNFQPSATVSRADLAVVVGRAVTGYLDLFAPSTGYSYSDISGLASVYTQAIEYLTNDKNLSGGRVTLAKDWVNYPLLYCPNDTATRADVATFVARAFVVPD